MKHTNYYPVSYKDFVAIRSPGNYILMYALLDDRIHFELAVENSVYITHRFYSSIKEELKRRADNYAGSFIKYLLDYDFSKSTAYRFYPTTYEIEYFKSIKLYSKLIVAESEKTELNTPLAVIEYDDRIESINSEDVKVLVVQKVN